MFKDMHVDHIEFNARASQIAPRVTAWRYRAAPHAGNSNLSRVLLQISPPLRRRAKVATTLPLNRA